MQKAKFICIFT